MRCGIRVGLRGVAGGGERGCRGEERRGEERRGEERGEGKGGEERRGEERRAEERRGEERKERRGEERRGEENWSWRVSVVFALEAGREISRGSLCKISIPILKRSVLYIPGLFRAFIVCNSPQSHRHVCGKEPPTRPIHPP